MLLETVPVFGKPHPLPLLWRDTSGLWLLVVYGGSAEYRTVLGLEHGHTLDAVQVDALVRCVEQIHLQFGFALRQGIVFLRQFATYLVDVIQRLLESGEETVQVILVGIDAVTGLAFGFIYSAQRFLSSCTIWICSKPRS